VDWAIVLLIAAGIAGVVQARSRMAAVAMLGLTGFTVAGWFVLLGAPDLALTQLLIETLTVVVVVLVFRHLPPHFPRGGRRRKVGAGVFAVAVGGFTGLTTYLLAGRRDLSDAGAQFLAEGEGLTGGANVVNTILVDFRALDTFGEIAVLAIAAAGMIAIVRMPERGAVARPVLRDDSPETPRPLPMVGMIDSPILRTAASLLAPAMVVASLWLLVRGHDAVGGGFIGGLTAGAAVVVLFVSRGHERIWQSRFLRAIPLLGSGLLVAALYGLGGLMLAGALLSGAKVPLPLVGYVAASLLFDIGVYLVVVGLVTSVLRHLGQDAAEPPADPDRYRPAPTTETSVEAGVTAHAATHPRPAPGPASSRRCARDRRHHRRAAHHRWGLPGAAAWHRAHGPGLHPARPRRHHPAGRLGRRRPTRRAVHRRVGRPCRPAPPGVRADRHRDLVRDHRLPAHPRVPRPRRAR
jgi:multicomponent Na+:H+ antiporter subunit A